MHSTGVLSAYITTPVCNTRISHAVTISANEMEKLLLTGQQDLGLRVFVTEPA